MAKYNHIVVVDGVWYESGVEVPTPGSKKTIEKVEEVYEQATLVPEEPKTRGRKKG